MVLFGEAEAQEVLAFLRARPEEGGAGDRRHAGTREEVAGFFGGIGSAEGTGGGEDVVGALGDVWGQADGAQGVDQESALAEVIRGEPV